MRFFRRRSNPGLVALLAIAMQAALVLAHMHVHSHVHTGAGAYRGMSAAISTGARARTKNVAALSCRAMVQVHSGCPPLVPHDHGNDCPMCWSVAAAGTGVMPEAPAVALDAPRFTMLAPVRVAEVRPGRAILNFQARAPPVA
jgi:hypothetical protein